MANYIPLSVPSFQGNERRYVDQAVDAGWVSTGGAFITDFESAFARKCGSPNAVATCNGTAAIHVALLESGVGPGDMVIVPTVTFIAPVNAVKYVGAEPVFMDCDQHLNMDSRKVLEFIQQECDFDGTALRHKTTKCRVRAMIPVHVFGHPADLEPLLEAAERYGIAIIEDATESLGSVYTEGKLKGRQTGTIGSVGCFSFNGNKIITTGGGGMIVTADEKHARHMKYLTTQAKDDDTYYVHDEVGYNYRMTNLQAALGLAQLEALERYMEIKRRNYERYKAALEGHRGLRFIEEPRYAHSNYWFYSLIIEPSDYGTDRDHLLQHLESGGIQSRPPWKLNHLQKPYVNCLGYRIELAPEVTRKALNIPCSVGLSEADINRVIDAIRSYTP